MRVEVLVMLNKAAKGSNRCRCISSTICAPITIKRRRILAFRISWKRLRLFLFIIIVLLTCIYVQLADSSVKFGMFSAVALFGGEMDVGESVRLIYMADSAPWFNARVAMQLLRDTSCPVQNCLFTCESTYKAVR